VSGGFWGMLIGMIFLNPLLGAAVGAGAVSGKITDIGIDDTFIKEFSANFTPGGSALFVLFREVSGDKVLERLKDFKGKVLKTSLPMDDEEKLRKALEA